MAGSLLHTLFFFIIALSVLIAFHEFGHFWAARRLGVKVLRFSLGFGKTIWRHQNRPDETEFVVAALPLGGYVKMVDEREGPVAAADLPHAFNRQPLLNRAAIVAAGPISNLILAVALYWCVFMIGEVGLRPILGPVVPGTLAAQAGFQEGDEIVSVGDDKTPIWNLAVSEVVERAMDESLVPVVVRSADGVERKLTLVIDKDLAQQPETLYKNLGFMPSEPEIEPVIERTEPGSAAEKAGLLAGDRIESADGIAVSSWKQWVEYVRERPDRPIRVTIDRNGVRVPVDIIPRSVDTMGARIGRIGAAVRVPDDFDQSMRVTYRLSPMVALATAVEKTAEYSTITLKMVGRMLVGKAAVENLSGPISIAQYAGQSASMGLNHFLKFLAIVSISLGVLNLLPIPVLDGGHLMLYLIESIKGSPVSEQTQVRFQQVGMLILLCLMSLAFVLDLERLLT